MTRLPGALFIVDTKKEHIAVAEARRLGIPIIGMVDTNCDPDVVDFPIPCNDDAFKSIAVVAKAVADSIAEANSQRSRQAEEAAREKEKAEGGKEEKEPVEAAVEEVVEKQEEAKA